jgi:hypothetical protein
MAVAGTPLQCNMFVPVPGREDRSEREVAELQRQAAEAEARHEVTPRCHSAGS